MIYESRDLTAMDTYTPFDKLQEHEIKMKRLAMDEEGERKIKSLALKAEDFDSDRDMPLLVQNFKKFLKHEKQ